MDAPVSSFDTKKKALFLNHMSDLSGSQRIVLMMDLLVENRNTGDLELAREFNEIRNKKSFLLKLRRPFKQDDLSTISTQVIEL
jgi:hypothetical protein